MKIKNLIFILLFFCTTFAHADLDVIEIGSDGVKTSDSPTTLTETAPRVDISYFDAFTLGIVEGVTEYLPVSSTGHLILTNSFLKLDSDAPLTTKEGKVVFNKDMKPYTLKDATNAYAIVIQIGAILAVAILYWKHILIMIAGLLGRNNVGLRLFVNLLVAFMPAAIVGFLFHAAIESYLFGVKPVIFALTVGAILMFVVQKRYQQNTSYNRVYVKMEDMRVRQSFLIGALQCVAMWPGTSRSMMTILGGYFVGMNPADSAKFSFLLGLVTLSAASIFKMYKDGEAIVQSLSIAPLALGLVVAFISATLSVKWLVSFLTRKGLTPFAWYRIALALVLSLLLYFDIIA